MKVLIVGSGYKGRAIIELLCGHYDKIIAIDIIKDHLNKLPEIPNVSKINGDGSDINILLKAGIENSGIFLALTDDDHVNLMAALIARKMFKIKRVICRLNDNTHKNLFEKHGLLVLNPAESFAASFQGLLGEGIL